MCIKFSKIQTLEENCTLGRILSRTLKTFHRKTLRVCARSFLSSFTCVFLRHPHNFGVVCVEILLDFSVIGVIK